MPKHDLHLQLRKAHRVWHFCARGRTVDGVSDDEWDYLPHDDDLVEAEDLPAEEAALHVLDPDRPETVIPAEPARPVRQMFPDEQRDREPYREKEHDIEYLLEVQHYSFPEEHAD